MYDAISDVKPIGEARNQMVARRSDLEGLIERPLLQACQLLYDKNIRTLEADANSESVRRGEGSIVVEYSSLSAENRAIADENFGLMLSGDGIEITELIIQLENPDVAADEISQRALELAGKFKHQPMSWAPTYTFQQLLEIFECTEADGYKPGDFTKYGYFYDAENELFYLSEEHCKKANPQVRVLPRVRVVVETP